MMSALAVRLVVPGELAYRDLAIRTIAEACRLVSSVRRAAAKNGREREDSDDDIDLSNRFDAEMVSAFSEIFNNIALYSYGQKSGDIAVEIALSDDAMSVTLRDTGDSFDIDDVPAPELDSLPQHGMGIHIARAFVDELDYQPGPPNVWRLTKRAMSSNTSVSSAGAADAE